MPTSLQPRPAVDSDSDQARADGRRQRRDRNRDAVVRALLQLYQEGSFNPSIDEVAGRSGVSARSVFRYFDDVEELANAAITQQLLEVAPLFPVQVADRAPRAERIAALARHRATLFEAIASVGQVSRLKAPFNTVVAARLAESRAGLRDQLRTLFAPEFGALPAPRAAMRQAAADVLTSFESWHLMRTDQGLTAEAAEATLVDSLTMLLEG